jgi:hypothetical protein
MCSLLIWPSLVRRAKYTTGSSLAVCLAVSLCLTGRGQSASVAASDEVALAARRRLLKLGQPVVTELCFVRRLLVLAPRELLVQALLALPEQLRQRRDPLRHRRPGEVDERNPRLEAVGHHPVPHAHEPPVGQHLQKPACPRPSVRIVRDRTRMA